MAPVDDVDRIMAIMAAAFDPEYCEAWNRRQVEDALVLSNCHYMLAGPDGADIACAGASPVEAGPVEAAGFALSRMGFEEEELLLFAVLPKFRGRGIGNLMITRLAHAAAERGARRLLLEMRRGNSAESLYRRHGFDQIGLRKDYYRTISGPRIDALTFACPLLHE